MFKFPVSYTISVIPKLRWKHTGMVYVLLRLSGGSGLQSMPQPNCGAELVVDGHAGDIRLTSDRIDGEAGEAIARHE
jgi:hypothetical protein